MTSSRRLSGPDISLAFFFCEKRRVLRERQLFYLLVENRQCRFNLFGLWQVFDVFELDFILMLDLALKS